MELEPLGNDLPYGEWVNILEEVAQGWDIDWRPNDEGGTSLVCFIENSWHPVYLSTGARPTPDQAGTEDLYIRVLYGSSILKEKQVELEPLGYGVLYGQWLNVIDEVAQDWNLAWRPNAEGGSSLVCFIENSWEPVYLSTDASPTPVLEGVPGAKDLHIWMPHEEGYIRAQVYKTTECAPDAGNLVKALKSFPMEGIKQFILNWDHSGIQNILWVDGMRTMYIPEAKEGLEPQTNTLSIPVKEDIECAFPDGLEESELYLVNVVVYWLGDPAPGSPEGELTELNQQVLIQGGAEDVFRPVEISLGAKEIRKAISYGSSVQVERALLGKNVHLAKFKGGRTW